MLHLICFQTSGMAGSMGCEKVWQSECEDWSRGFSGLWRSGHHQRSTLNGKMDKCFLNCSDIMCVDWYICSILKEGDLEKF